MEHDINALDECPMFFSVCLAQEIMMLLSVAMTYNEGDPAEPASGGYDH